MAPKKSKPPTKPTTTTPSVTPDWPPLHPRLAPEKQRLTSLLENQIITTPLLPAPLAATYRTFLANLPLTVVPQERKKDHALRLNDRYQIEDARFADQLWHQTGLSALVQIGGVDGEDLSDAAREALWGGHVLGLNPNIRIYRYREGHYFEQHYDEENALTFKPVGSGKGGLQARTTWTLLIYLSGPATGCEGGETVFYPDDEDDEVKVVAGLEVGMALLHRHGRDCLLHEGRRVTKGEKWVIRSDLVVKR